MQNSEKMFDFLLQMESQKIEFESRVATLEGRMSAIEHLVLGELRSDWQTNFEAL